jgi:hypothetical protein
MDSLFTGSVQSWFAVVVATLSPLTALIAGFEGADWLLRRRLGEVCDHAPLEGVEVQGRLSQPAPQMEQLRWVRCPDRRNSDRQSPKSDAASGAHPVQRQARDANQSYIIRY